jgi:hypothetical protein
MQAVTNETASVPCLVASCDVLAACWSKEVKSSLRLAAMQKSAGIFLTLALDGGV